MDYLEYRGYKGSVEYRKKGACLRGKVLGMHKDVIYYEGETLDALRENFETAIDSYISTCEADGVEPKKPFSGNMIVRMPSNLHEKIAMNAAEEGSTINGYIVHILEDNVRPESRSVK